MSDSQLGTKNLLLGVRTAGIEIDEFMLRGSDSKPNMLSRLFKLRSLVRNVFPTNF